MADVVDLFGANFDVTMETVFTTLEHTTRMLATTGENRDFKNSDLKAMRSRLEQSIAAVFEESLTETGPTGDSTHKRKLCETHKRFVESALAPNDDIVSFNYDCVLDDALSTYGDGKWNPRYGYGFNLGARGKNLEGDRFWSPATRAERESTAHHYKLHGSLHFQVKGDGPTAAVTLKKHPYTKRNGKVHFSIIPPEWHKAYDSGVFSLLWKNAASAVHRAQHVVFVGYSLPPTDLHSTALFRTAIKKNNLRSVVVVNPDSEARRRIRDVLQRGIHKHTRVHSVNSFNEFVAMSPSIWRV